MSCLSLGSTYTQWVAARHPEQTHNGQLVARTAGWAVGRSVRTKSEEKQPGISVSVFVGGGGWMCVFVCVCVWFSKAFRELLGISSMKRRRRPRRRYRCTIISFCDEGVGEISRPERSEKFASSYDGSLTDSQRVQSRARPAARVAFRCI